MLEYLSYQTIIYWFILAALVGFYASTKGRSGFGYFLLAILLSPLIGFLIALLSAPDIGKTESKQINSGNVKKCSFCAELIKKEAIFCRYCHHDLPEKNDEVSDVIQETTCSNCGKYCNFDVLDNCWNCNDKLNKTVN